MTDEAEGKDDVVPLPAGCKAALLDGAWSCGACGTARPMDSAHPGCKRLSLPRLRSVVDAAIERERGQFLSLSRIANDPLGDPAIRTAINPWPAAVRAAELTGVAMLLERVSGNDAIMEELIPGWKKKVQA
jgi:hypothetical protein